MRDSSPPSVLIVDDNPGDRYIAEYMLAKSGRFGEVYWLSDGQDALALFTDHAVAHAAHPERFPPAVLLLDINMPRLGGFEFLDALAALGLADLPTVILMLTSSTLASDTRRAAEQALVKGYIVKPFTVQHAHRIADDISATRA